ncbi:MAG: cyclase family protein [Deltaproteobacteria bacterium]|jgi:kynurenine formamidase|nr:cyclase family protein [Deltaproteobacteria bacterium]
MSGYVEVGYPIYTGMPLYPGLPEVTLNPREQIAKGDSWNGTVLSIYTHAGTHVDAPCHYVAGAKGIDAIPIADFIYKRPLMLNTFWEPNHMVTIEEIKTLGGNALYQADILFFNTGHWKFRENEFAVYCADFPSVSPEAAEFIRTDLPGVKAVAIDTLSIENMKVGATNGFRTHNAFLNPDRFPQRTLLIYEDYNPQPLLGKTLLSSFTAPLRLRGTDGAVVNIVVEIEN